jgi:tRNA A37 threonylcarbamoyladenosine synthetase subunit TsaC/SUA5/YrdC
VQAIAVPTDTLYGLAASATTSAAIRVSLRATRRCRSGRVDGATSLQRLYSIKRRDERVPLSISVADAQVRIVVGMSARASPL